MVEPSHAVEAAHNAQLVNNFGRDPRHFPDSSMTDNSSFCDGVTHARRDPTCVTNIRRNPAAPPPPSRPLNKVKSDSCLPPKGHQQQMRHVGQLRHRVTINTIPIVPSLTVTPSFSVSPSLPVPPPHRTQRSHSSSNLMPLVAPLAEIDEHSADLDFHRIRITEYSGLRRRDPPPMLTVHDGRKSLSLTKISDAPIYISVPPQIRRNASWTTMTAAMNS